MGDGGRVFSVEERAYLNSLPAVRSAGERRICYTDAFRHECLRRYMDGERPTALFREAGLYPELIGYKRIERAFARWRAEAHLPAQRKAGRPYGSRTRQPGLERSAKSDADARDMLIAQQLHYIHELRRRIDRLGHRQRRSADGDEGLSCE